MKKEFGFKDLKVWQKALDLADQVIDTTENLNTNRKHFRLIEQIEGCSASIAQNIAEGKGRRSNKEFIQFLYIARGSLYETVTLLNLFHRRGWIDTDKLDFFEEQAFEIASMIKGLINSLYDK
jgi:four helix bundle protein